MFLKTYNLEKILEWAETDVAVGIAGTVVVTIARVIVGVVVIASPISTRVTGIARSFRFIPNFIILYKIIYLLNF
ncbi:MAG: hypothetical protein ACLUHC_06945 [Clostridia bacterium]